MNFSVLGTFNGVPVKKKHPVLYIKWYHMIGQQIWVMIKPYVANIVSDFGKLPSACLGSCVKGWEARTPEQLWNLFFYCISLFGLKTPYVGCVIGNVPSASRCVENTTGSKTRSTDTRYLRFAKKCCCQNLEWDHLRSISIKWNTSPPRPWHSDVDRHVPWWKIKPGIQQFLGIDKLH